MTITQMTTDWVNFSEHGRDYQIRATYGFDVDFARRNNQAPYFSVTGEIRNARTLRVGSCGQLHTEIVKYFPHLAPLVKWHLVSTVEPMHYVANGLFWYDEGKRLGWRTIDTAHYHTTNSLENLRKTIVFRAVKSDKGIRLTRMSRAKLALYLEARKPALMQAFRSAVTDAGLDYPEF